MGEGEERVGRLDESATTSTFGVAGMVAAAAVDIHAHRLRLG